MSLQQNKSLRHQTVISFFWKLLEQILRKASSFIVSLILAWILAPDDFGVIAIISVFVSFSYILVNGGFLAAIIRKQDISEKDLNTIFYTNLIISAIVYLLIYISAPKIALFYNQQILIDLLRFVGFAFFFQALYVVPLAILQKKLQFHLQLKVSIPTAVLSGLGAILLAYLGYGIWALAWQIVLAPIFTAFFIWRLNIWRPKLIYSKASLLNLFSFSSYILLENLLKELYFRMYIIVLAKIFSASIVGLYYFAERMKDVLIQQAISAIQQVTFPALSQMQGNDIRLLENYRKVVVVTTYILFPILAGLAVFSNTIFDLILPDKWSDSAKMLQLMAIASFVLPLISLNQNIWMVKGNANLLFYIGLYEKVIGVSIFIFSIDYGIEGILIGQIFAGVISYIPFLFFAHKKLQYSVINQFSDFTLNLIFALTSGIIIYFIMQFTQIPPVLNLIGMGLLFTIIYIGLGFIFKIQGFLLIKELLMRKIIK